MVRDQAFASRDLTIGSVIDDVALVVRVIRQFSKERIETTSDFVVGQFAKLVNQNRCRFRIERTISGCFLRTVAIHIESDVDRSRDSSTCHRRIGRDRYALCSLTRGDRARSYRPVVGLVLSRSTGGARARAAGGRRCR